MIEISARELVVVVLCASSLFGALVAAGAAAAVTAYVARAVRELPPRRRLSLPRGGPAASTQVPSSARTVLLEPATRPPPPPAYDPAAVRSPPVPPPKVAGWLRPPEVFVHGSCHLPLGVVEQAVGYWRGLGHRFGGVHEIDDSSSIRGHILVVGRGPSSSVATQISACGRPWDDGVDLADLDPGDHYCQIDDVVSCYRDGQIDHAVVVVPPPAPGMNMDLVLIHLLGHALGYAHAGSVARGGTRPEIRRGHVMSPTLSVAGWKTDGLEA